MRRTLSLALLLSAACDDRVATIELSSVVYFALMTAAPLWVCALVLERNRT